MRQRHPLDPRLTQPSLYIDKVALARQFRRAMTPAERTLWGAIRAKALGIRWRRQHVLRGFILDFYAPAIAVAIEVDGAVHAEQSAEDRAREDALRAEGITVARFSNREVLHQLDDVLRRLREACVEAVRAR